MGADITVFSLGGTIAMVPEADGRAVPALTGEQLVASVPGLAGLDVRVETRDFLRLPGASLSFQDLHRLAAEINACTADGVVVTQGTDSIEETSYLLDLLHVNAAPLVVTGAMRNPGMAGADGPANVLAAVQVAADPAARDRGCLVVLADEIHAAAHVRKTHSTSPATFASPTTGPVGQVVEGRPRFWAPPPPARSTLHVPNVSGFPRVALFTATLGDDDQALRAVAEHADGLVVAAMGVGHVPESYLGVLARTARRIPVVLASRTGSGSTLTRTYGYPGSESGLLAGGLIGAGFLHPYKARILLTLLLTAGALRDDIAAAFGRAGTPSA